MGQCFFAFVSFMLLTGYQKRHPVFALVVLKLFLLGGACIGTGTFLGYLTITLARKNIFGMTCKTLSQKVLCPKPYLRLL